RSQVSAAEPELLPERTPRGVRQHDTGLRLRASTRVGQGGVDVSGDVGNSNEGAALAGRLVERLARDLAEIVDVVRVVQMLRVARHEHVEIRHDAVLPDERAAARE